jgi:rod shape determining protein RodA
MTRRPLQVIFFRTSAGKQAIWMVISILAFFLITLIEWKFWQTFSYLIYGVSVFLLVAVLLFGTNIKGATSWFTFGSFSFQPAEIAKFGTSLALANFLSTYSSDLRDLRTQFISFCNFPGSDGPDPIATRCRVCPGILLLYDHALS